MAYETKNTDEIKNNIVLNMITNVEEINDANIGSALDVFTTSISQEIKEQYDDIKFVYESSRITTAQGQDLDEIGKIVGVNRGQGIKSQGTVTFKRNTPAANSFTIPINTVVSTQPNTDDPQLQYTTLNSTLFRSSIIEEPQLFIEGINEYKLDSRFIHDVSSLNAIVNTDPETLVKNTDYIIEKGVQNRTIISTPNLNVIEECEANTGWNGIGVDTDTSTVNTTTKLRGTGSLNLIKDGTTQNFFGYEKDTGNDNDITNLSLFTNVYIDDQGSLDKISSIQIFASSDSSFSNSYIYETNVLNIGWNLLLIDRSKAAGLSIQGNPDFKKIRYIRIRINTTENADTIAAEKVIMDFWYSSTYVNYTGDIIIFLGEDIPDDNTAMNFSYIPLSVEVQVAAEEIGNIYNVTLNKIEFIVSALVNISSVRNYTPISGGIDIESDTDLRFRIQRAADIANVSTVNAIQFNVLGLDFVQNCQVIDTPDKFADDENYIYNSATKKIKLHKFVALDTNNLKISNTSGGSANYVKNTDYILNDNNEIDFDIGGSEPTNGNTVYIDYDYKQLGWFEVNVSGVLGALTTSELEEIEDVIEEKKAAGIKYLLTEPSYDVVELELTLDINSNFSLASIESEIKLKTAQYINSLNIGQNVLIAGIIKTVMSVNGVDNVSIDSLTSNEYPGNTGDLTVDIGHKATIITGDITLNE